MQKTGTGSRARDGGNRGTERLIHAPRQQQHSLAEGVAGSKDGFDAGDGDGFGGRVGGKSGSLLHGKLSAFDTPPETPQEAQDDA